MTRPPELLFEGVVEHHGNFAFLLSEEPGKPDVFLKGPTLRLAMDGDRAVARLVSREGDKIVGEILKVVTRGRRTVTGVLRRRNFEWVAEPEEGHGRDALKVLGWPKTLEPKEGEVVVVRISQWPTFKTPAAGTVEEVLGRPGAPGVRLSAVLRSRGIQEAFPQEALAESEALGAPSAADLQARLDLRELPVFTIDGADAKDFDDAVSLEAVGPNLRLGIHIADVAHYVRPGTALDQEAIGRGTSVYVADRVVPMLPPRLSEDLCSLRPDVERLTMSCMVDLDREGHVLKAELKESVIRSRRRFTYEEVQALLKGEAVERVDDATKQAVLEMGKLAALLTESRIRRGALDMTMPEYKVLVDESGRATGVERRPRLASHRLIEEFMLLANEAVARELEERKVPFLYRIHDDPQPRRLETLIQELQQMRVFTPEGLATDPARGIQIVLARAVGHPLEDIINLVTVRSLKQARYTDKPGGHFGLASKAYCHFTSPIRRYPDLLNHRAVKALLHERRGEHLPAMGLAELGEHCSLRERTAVDAERTSVDILRASLLQDKIGDRFDAVVTGGAAVGLFVTFTSNGASALARRARAPLGSRVTVQLVGVDAARGELDVKILPRAGAGDAAGGRGAAPRREWKNRPTPPGEAKPAAAAGEPKPEPAPGEPKPQPAAEAPRREFPPKKPWERGPKKDFGPRKPWEKREGGRPDRPRRDGPPGAKPWEKKKPWEKREGRPEGGAKPWERKPYVKREGAPGAKPWEKKPWEKREGRPEGGAKPWERKPYVKREGAPGAKPWEKKPWEKREGRPEGGAKPWEKKPYVKREGAPGSKPWERGPKKDFGPRKPWGRDKREGGAPSGPSGGPKKFWEKREIRPGDGPARGPKKPWEKKPWVKREGSGRPAGKPYGPKKFGPAKKFGPRKPPER